MNEPLDWNAIPMDWVGDYVGRRAALTPDRCALIEAETGRHWRYDELDAAVARTAHWLTDTLGIGRGERLGLVTRNTIEAVRVYLACGRAGVVLVPLSHRLAAAEMTALVRRSGARAVLVEPALADAIAGVGTDGVDWHWLDTDTVAAQDAMPASPSGNVALALNDPFLYVHTGGSTGVPKLCIVSHRQMTWNALELIAASPAGLGERRELLLFPLYHIGGWNTVTPILHAGGCVVLLPAFDPVAVLGAVAAHRVNHFGAVEAMLRAISASPGFADADLSPLAGITTAGAPCSDAAMAPFRARGIPVGQSYGQTEAGPSNFIHLGRGDDPAALVRHSGSVGSAFPHCDYRIVADDGAPAPRGGAGELWLRSPHAFDGYVDDPERTAAVLDADGWVHTGDLAREDESGRVSIVGRVDNVFVSGGENIAPEEIETVLLDHEAIAEAGVFPAADPHWGAVPVAVLVAAAGAGLPDADALGDWLSGRLARFKHPRRYIRVQSLPRTGAGKVDRAALARTGGA